MSCFVLFSEQFLKFFFLSLPLIFFTFSSYFYLVYKNSFALSGLFHTILFWFMVIVSYLSEIFHIFDVRFSFS